MRARLIKIHDCLELLICNGQIKKMSQSNAKSFLLTFDSKIHYQAKGSWDYGGISMEDYGGITIAYVSKSGDLIVKNSVLFREIFTGEISYLTTKEYAEKVGKQRAIVLRMCNQGRIAGAVQKGTTWLIPEDAPYPADARIGKRV